MGTRRDLIWTCWWMIALGIIHTVFGFVAYSAGWLAISRGGFWNAVDGELIREHAFWFTLFGPMTVLLGSVMLWIERYAQRALPKFLGWSFLVLAGVAVVFMPFSGFWLLVPPGIGLVWPRGRNA